MTVRFSIIHVSLSLLLCWSATLFGQQYPSADLPPLLSFNDGTPVVTPEEWSLRRDEVFALMQETFIGSFPQQTPSIINSQILSTSVAPDGSTRQNVRLTFDTPNQASFDMWVWTPQGNEPHPLLLVAPRYYQLAWAETALARGYAVCLYPGIDSNHSEADYPGYQDVWKTFQSEYPEANWSEIATKAWIAGRALDYLLDPAAGYNLADGQVAIIGHSRYGKQALVAGAIDQRITAIVARSAGSPGSTPYRFASRAGFNEAPSDFPGQWFIPELRSYVGREDQMPFDAHGWAALIAPRNLLLDTAYYDDCDPTFGTERAFVAASAVYQLLGVEDHFRLDYRDGWHDPITQQRRDRNLDWLDVAFNRGTATRNDFPQVYLHQFDWNKWQSKLSPQQKQNPFPNTTPIDNTDRRARIEWALGRPPAEIPFDGQYTFYTPEQSEMIGHDRWAVPGVARTPVSFGENIHGNIYYNTEKTGPAPVVIWLHPYSYPSGYNEAYGVEGTTIYHRLAKEGYAVLCFDQVGFGQRLWEGSEFYDDYPEWSRLGRMIHDVQAAVDFLTEGKGAAQGTMPNIDPGQIHVLGYSLGGMVALYGAAMDERIVSVASFAGFTPMRTDTADKPTGGLARLWQWHALQPMLGLFDGRENQIPYDFGDVLALVAPRPTLIYSPQHDRYADYSEVASMVQDAKVYWAQVGAADQLTFMSPEDYGRFQTAQQNAYINWLGQIILLPGEVAWLNGLSPSLGRLPDAADSHLRLWLAADAGLVNTAGNSASPGERIATWLDRSAQQNDAATRNGSPTVQIITCEGREIPIVRFDGASSLHTTLGSFDSPAGTLFLVADQQQPGNQKWISFREAAAVDKLGWFGSGNSGFGDMLDFGLGHTASLSDPINENALTGAGGLHIYTIHWGEEDGQIVARLFVDGRLKHTVAKNLELSAGLCFEEMFLCLGQRAWDESGFFIGDIGELLFYDRQLSFQQLNDVGAYLATKYAVNSRFLVAVPEPSAGTALLIGGGLLLGFAIRHPGCFLLRN